MADRLSWETDYFSVQLAGRETVQKIYFHLSSVSNRGFTKLYTTFNVRIFKWDGSFVPVCTCRLRLTIAMGKWEGGGWISNLGSNRATLDFSQIIRLKKRQITMNFSGTVALINFTHIPLASRRYLSCRVGENVISSHSVTVTFPRNRQIVQYATSGVCVFCLSCFQRLCYSW